MSQSKQELRAQRRAHREALEQAHTAADTRRRRLFRLGAAVASAVVIVAIAAVVSTSSNGAPKSVTASTVVQGVPETNGVLGDPNAPVTITEYVDLQCPVCAQASTNTLPTLIEDYVKTGKVKLEARTLHFLGPDSTTAAKVAAGAQQQNKLWSFLETFYANQGSENSGYVTDDFLKSVATTAGVNADQALEYAKTDPATAALDKANADAQAVGADSTPTFTIKRGDGQETTLAVGATDLTTALDKALAG